MLTFSSPSAAPAAVQPSAAGWIGALAAPLAAWFSGTARPARPQERPGLEPSADRPSAIKPVDVAAADPCGSGAYPGGAAPSTPAPEAAPAAVATYWPCERLNAFMLKMAAHGRCVNAAMMLGHRPYARLQLAAARQLPDDGLHALADELQAYFDARPEVAADVLKDSGTLH
ncbi:hypothetical protein [Paracidovorax sp. MALMAid1276]|uniref:hypothetical protein n=1 Tax=Paracidovorax sp. MALMAid1276 TaxID=3411631 RepID=UPI003B9AEA0D